MRNNGAGMGKVTEQARKRVKVRSAADDKMSMLSAPVHAITQMRAPLHTLNRTWAAPMRSCRLRTRGCCTG